LGIILKTRLQEEVLTDCTYKQTILKSLDGVNYDLKGATPEFNDRGNH